MTPDEAQDLVTIAFTLEALADKEGCTSRFVDLPEKPLQDFLIAGINAGKHFRHLAEAWEKGEKKMFSHLVMALKTANAYKSAKMINFGLLEAMSIAVAARLASNDSESVVDEMSKLVALAGRDELQSLLAARHLAWQTSRKEEKRSFPADGYSHLTTLGEFYASLTVDYPPESSNHQWGWHIMSGFPILQRMLVILEYSVPPGDTAGHSVTPTQLAKIIEGDRVLRHEYPHIKRGITADYWAVAIFLHLSFLPPQTVLK